MKFKDFYQVLGVAEGASDEKIKRAYRQLARKYHPDVSTEPGAEERFKEINQAYETLKDDQRRAEYDQLRRYGFRDGDDISSAPHGRGTADFGDGSFGNVDFSELFESIFGQTGYAKTGAGGRHHNWPQQGDDISLTVRISLENAYRGGKTRISLPARHGRQLNVNIPAGVTEGQQLRLRAQGNPGSNGGPAGDLIITIALKPHELFTVEGSTIRLTVPVTPYEAATGVKVSVPTLSGPVALSIPANTVSGTKMRLRGKGLPGGGDQIVEVQINLPEKLSKASLALLKQFEQEAHYNPRAHFVNPAYS